MNTLRRVKIANPSDNGSMTVQEQYLLKEYDSAVTLTNNLDELRNKFTSFYLVFTGTAVAAISFMLQGQLKVQVFGEVEYIVAYVMLFVALCGTFVIRGIARLRKVQLEHFGIINNIRDYFLQDNCELKTVVQLSSMTLPRPSLTSGSYMWVLLVMFTSSSLAGGGILLLLNKGILVNLPWVPSSTEWTGAENASVAAFSFVIVLLVQNWLYFRVAQPPEQRDYCHDSTVVVSVDTP
jgi:hypothetical protein